MSLSPRLLAAMFASCLAIGFLPAHLAWGQEQENEEKVPLFGQGAEEPAADPAETSPRKPARPVRQQDSASPEAAPEGRRAKCPSPEELEQWFKPLDRIGLSMKPAEGELPIDCAENLFFRPEGGGETRLRNW